MVTSVLEVLALPVRIKGSSVSISNRRREIPRNSTGEVNRSPLSLVMSLWKSSLPIIIKLNPLFNKYSCTSGIFNRQESWSSRISSPIKMGRPLVLVCITNTPLPNTRALNSSWSEVKVRLLLLALRVSLKVRVPVPASSSVLLKPMVTGSL